MGVFFVFTIYVTVVAIIAAPCALVSASIGLFLARKTSGSIRKSFAIYGAILPVAVGVYVLGIIVAMALFGVATDRDFGFGDGFDIPLNNGYQWSATDITEVASVYERRDTKISKGMGSSSIPRGYPTAFDDVLSLQQHGDWLAGTYLSNLDRTKFDMQWKPDHWFLFNTKTHERLNAINETQLQSIAKGHGFALALEPSADFYSHQRYRWYDALMLFILFVPGFLAARWLWKKAMGMLHEDASAEIATHS